MMNLENRWLVKTGVSHDELIARELSIERFFN